MATSSITKNFVIKDSKSAETLAQMMLESLNKPRKEESTKKISSIATKDQIKKIFKGILNE